MGFRFGERKTTTFIAGLHLSGLAALMVLHDPINGTRSETYVEQVLVPTLKKGDVLIMDNLSRHKRA